MGNIEKAKKIWPGLFNSDSLWDAKPYLRPISSMTMEEQREYITVGRSVSPDNPSILADWLNANHFDFRGLIPMGLALEAPEDMYRKKNDIMEE